MISQLLVAPMHRWYVPSERHERPIHHWQAIWLVRAALGDHLMEALTMNGLPEWEMQAASVALPGSVDPR
jgi:hypothetical protein